MSGFVSAAAEKKTHIGYTKYMYTCWERERESYELLLYKAFIDNFGVKIQERERKKGQNKERNRESLRNMLAGNNKN